MDDICEKYEVERIKVFRGDEYRIFSQEDPLAVADFSLAAMQYIKEYLIVILKNSTMTMFIFAKSWQIKQGLRTESVDVRIGIFSTPLYGGIIGSEGVTYDHYSISTPMHPFLILTRL